MPGEFLLFCKSYRADLLRVKRLLESVERFNADGLPMVVCVPRDDAGLFRDIVAGTHAELVHDEDVIAKQPDSARLDLLARYRATVGQLHQQVVKAEAWRLLGCTSYLSVDSDTVFLRPFFHRDFLSNPGEPYTVLHQSREYLQLAIDRGQTRVLDHFIAESTSVMQQFGRSGPHYDFGPQPLIWAAAVWASLHERWLAPRGRTLWDAIELVPSEIRWYGEALLAYGAIPLRPVEPLFRVYHHAWQYDLLRRLGETDARLVNQYLGVVLQSNWDHASDLAGARSAGSLAVRRVKRWLAAR